MSPRSSTRPAGQPSTLSVSGSLPGADVIPLAPAAGALAAFQAAAASLVVVLVPVVLTWVASGGGTTSWIEVVQLGTALWLLAQHTGLAVDGGHLGLVPLGAALIPLLACAYAGIRVSRSLDPRAERIASGASRAQPTPMPRSALVTMALTHGAIGALAASLAATDVARPILWQAVVGPTVIAALGGGLGSLAYAQGGRLRAGLAAVPRLVPDALAGEVRRYLAPVGLTVAVQLGAGALALLVGLGFGAGRVIDLYAALGGGFVGAAMITLLQLLLLPNLVIWAACLLAGPGFALGTGTEISPLTSTLGPLPALPVLGALPDPGPMPGYAIAVVASGVLAGVVGGSRLLRAGERADRSPILGALQDLLVLAGGSGLALGVLAWASGGPAGPGRMSQVGPTPWLVAGTVAIEVMIGVALVVLVRQVAPALADAVARRRTRTP